jgi:hypothetical protein
MSPSVGARVTRFGRAHVLALVIAAFVAWLAVAVYVAAQHGEHRRMTFNGSIR